MVRAIALHAKGQGFESLTAHMNIDGWLQKFKEYWQTHNIDGVLGLFDKNVIYYETPSNKLENFEALAKEWKSITEQNNISLIYQIFSSDKNKYSVIFKLKYFDKQKVEKNFAGTYLIELNNTGLCTYFHQTCEEL